MFCDEGQQSTSASLWYQTPEESVRSLFHDPTGCFTFLGSLEGESPGFFEGSKSLLKLT